MNPKGHGLGLSICYDIAQLLKGSLSVISKKDFGSCFIFKFEVRELSDGELKLAK